MLLKLRPAFADYLWGGSRLKTEYGKDFAGDVLAESWELSCHPHGMSTVEEGPYAGLTLPELGQRLGGVFGENCARFADFPVLVKLIDARLELSVQVHPDDAYARAHEGQNGKTEMWYVVDCEPGAQLYFGLRRAYSREEVEAAIGENRFTELLQAVPVKRGDVFFIEAGTIHAIGAGILIAEVQQNSNVTYRVYDFGRRGADGKLRELHVEKALDVARLGPAKTDYDFKGHLAACDYFTVDALKVSGLCERAADSGSFHHLLILDGGGTLTCGGKRLLFGKGDSLLVTAGSGPYRIEGECEALLTAVPAFGEA